GCLNGGWCQEGGVCDCAQFQALGDRCQIIPNQGQDRDGICRSWGQHHYETFDGIYFYFPGTCSYILAQDSVHFNHLPPVTLYFCQVHNSRVCDGSVYSCPRALSLFFPNEEEIHISGYQVHQGGHRCVLPQTVGGVFIERLADYLLVKSVFGFSLAWDGGSGVYLKMSEEHLGGPCGLCGNFNHLASDDLTTARGKTSLTDPPNHLSLLSAPTHLNYYYYYTLNTGSGQYRSEKCSALLFFPFLSCHENIDPNPFVASCVSDLCVSDDEETFCQALVEYTRACSHVGYPVREWRDSFPSCNDGCEESFVYRDCISCCPPTCTFEKECLGTNLHCLDGCYCPDGLILQNGTCIAVSQCPCVYHGTSYVQGHVLQQGCSVCVCMGGVWNCTENNCTAECSVVGDVFVTTFDGRMFLQPGSCQYVLVKSRSSSRFTVTLHNHPSVYLQQQVCIQSVTVVLDEDVSRQITLTREGEVIIGVNPVPVLPYVDDALEVQRLTSVFMQLKAAVGLRLHYDGRGGRVYLQLGSQWRGQTLGLCGTFNGNLRDDFLSPAGMIEGTPQLHANSWKVSSASDDSFVCVHILVFYASQCEVLLGSVFVACHGFISPNIYQQQCRYQACRCGSSCLCTALAHYAYLCSKHGVNVDFRSHVSECGMLHHSCVSSCGRFCRGLSGTETCNPDDCAEGCGCPNGSYHDDVRQLVLHHSKCYYPENCPCAWLGLEYLPGETVETPCYKCVCHRGYFNCSYSPCPAVCTVYSDRHYHTFDGLEYDYYSDCQVYLLKVSRVILCDCYESGIVCMKILVIHVGLTKIYFTDNSGIPNPSTVVGRGSEFELWRTGYYTVVHFSHQDLTILWDRKTTVHIRAGPQWKGLLSGLCGNFDSVTVNDMTTSSQMEVNNAQTFGDSWALGQRPCEGDLGRQPYAKRECALLYSDVFAPCHNVVDVAWFYRNCLTDTCNCNRGGDCECLCTSIAAYAHKCCQQGVTIHWRSPSVCPYDCEYFNQELGEGPFSLVSAAHNDTVFGVNRSSGSVFPLVRERPGQLPSPGLLFNFMITAGLQKERTSRFPVVSLESAERPNYFLVVSGRSLQLERWSRGPEFSLRGTFIQHQGLFLPGHTSFELVGQPGVFLTLTRTAAQAEPYDSSEGFKATGGFSSPLAESNFVIPYRMMCEWRYQACASPCVHSCGDPDATRCQFLPPVEGCFPRCPKNMVLDEVTRRCVYAEDCEYSGWMFCLGAPSTTTTTPATSTTTSASERVTTPLTLSPSTSPPAPPTTIFSTTPTPSTKPETTEMTPTQTTVTARETTTSTTAAPSIVPPEATTVTITASPQSPSTLSSATVPSTPTSASVAALSTPSPASPETPAPPPLTPPSTQPPPTAAVTTPVHQTTTGTPAAPRPPPGDATVKIETTTPTDDQVVETTSEPFPTTAEPISTEMTTSADTSSVTVEASTTHALLLPTTPCTVSVCCVCTCPQTHQRCICELKLMGQPRHVNMLWNTKCVLLSPQPPYSYRIDECAELICFNGELLLHNSSLHCRYSTTQPQCSLLGLPILINTDACCPLWQCPCRCTVMSDLRVITFDGNNVALYDNGSYILVNLPQETIIGTVEKCPTSQVTLRIKYLNYRPVRLPFSRHSLYVEDTGSMYLIHTPGGVSIQWYHSTGIMVLQYITPYNASVPTRGLCGCCDGNPEDDLKLPNGTVVREVGDMGLFLQAWRVHTTDETEHTRRVGDNCTIEDCSTCLSMLRQRAFTPCHSKVPPEHFCDIMWAGDLHYKDHQCDFLAAYVAVCYTHQVCISWRRHNFCPLRCPPGKEYQPCVSTCASRTCLNRDYYEETTCSFIREECVCRDGTILHRADSPFCVTEDRCVCTDNEGNPRAPGEVWNGSFRGCCLYKCMENGSVVAVEPDCSSSPGPLCEREGEYVLDVLKEGTCCPKKICECNMTICDSEAPPCDNGNRLVIGYSALSCCPEYRCECDAMACPPVSAPNCREDQFLVEVRGAKSCCYSYLCAVCESCIESIPSCSHGEILAVDLNTTNSCCPQYYCMCDVNLCPDSSVTCAPGLSLVQTAVPGHCCLQHHCGTHSKTLTYIRAQPIHFWWVLRPLCLLRVKKAEVCLFQGVTVLGPGQSLVQYFEGDMCYAVHCLHHKDPDSGFYAMEIISVNCSQKCGPVSFPRLAHVCCGSCKNVSCTFNNENGTAELFAAGSSWVENCTRYDCMETAVGAVILASGVICPPFNETECIQNGGVVQSYVDGCCRTCKEDGKTCKRVAIRTTIRKDDCRSNAPVTVYSCDGKCPSATIFNFNINSHARFCKCCRESGLQTRSVTLFCSRNATVVEYNFQEPLDCSCQWN
uniref:Otogelin-like n=1 Tax=Gasterosteus aculeatus aculeatus TaxID=481459 RepID=G3PI95_GASAC